MVGSVKSGRREVLSPVFCVGLCPEKILSPIITRKSKISTFLELLDSFLKLPFFYADTMTFDGLE